MRGHISLGMKLNRIWYGFGHWLLKYNLLIIALKIKTMEILPRWKDFCMMSRGNASIASFQMVIQKRSDDGRDLSFILNIQ